jgi:hypothetical protein
MTAASVWLSLPYETSWVDLLCWRRESHGIAARGKMGILLGADTAESFI